MPVYYLFYALCVVAAFLTAFYMARLMAMTFLGENRTGAEERRHLHEALDHDGPLVVLGVLTVVGVISLPTFVGGHHWLESWLEPVTAAAAARQGGAARTAPPSFSWSAARCWSGWSASCWGTGCSARRIHQQARLGPGCPGCSTEYFVDELYDAVVVRPLVRLSHGPVEGRGPGCHRRRGGRRGARLSRGLGWLGAGSRRDRSGGPCVVLFLVGALWILRAVIR